MYLVSRPSSLRVSDKRGFACSNSALSWVTTRQSANQTGAKKIQQAGETCKTDSYQPKKERRHVWSSVKWASVGLQCSFPGRAEKSFSHQGMTQTSAPFIYPGWVNVGTLSSAAEGWLGHDPPPPYLFDLCFEFCAWFWSARLSVVGWMWFIFLLSCHSK